MSPNQTKRKRIFNMKAFKSIKYYFAIVGIAPSKQHKFNVNIPMVFVMYSLNLIINGVYLFRQANDFQEIVNLIYVCSTHLVGLMTFIAVIWRTEDMFVFLDSLKKAISNSK